MKDTGGSAFPCNEHYDNTTKEIAKFAECGMTLRDYFAAKALQGMIGLENKEGHKRGAAGVPILAMYAYEYADAMLTARG